MCNSKKYNLLLVSGSVFALLVLIFLLCQQQEKVRTKCVNNMYQLWSAGRQCALLTTNDLLKNYVVGSDDLAKISGWGYASCCTCNGKRYSLFRLSDGPKCPNGHGPRWESELQIWKQVAEKMIDESTNGLPIEVLFEGS